MNKFSDIILESDSITDSEKALLKRVGSLGLKEIANKEVSNVRYKTIGAYTERLYVSDETIIEKSSIGNWWNITNYWLLTKIPVNRKVTKKMILMRIFKENGKVGSITTGKKDWNFFDEEYCLKNQIGVKT